MFNFFSKNPLDKIMREVKKINKLLDKYDEKDRILILDQCVTEKISGRKLYLSRTKEDIQRRKDNGNN